MLKDIAEGLLQQPQQVKAMSGVHPVKRSGILYFPDAFYAGLRKFLFHPVAQIGEQGDHIAFNRCQRVDRDLEIADRPLKGGNG